MQPIHTVEDLEDELSRPTPGVHDALKSFEGDVLVLGAGGKMGPTLARMVRRGLDAIGHTARRVIGQDLGHAIANPVDAGRDEVGLLPSAGLRREDAGPHERPERLVEVAFGGLDDTDIEVGGGPPQPGGRGDSRGAASENEDPMMIWHGELLQGAFSENISKYIDMSSQMISRPEKLY